MKAGEAKAAPAFFRHQIEKQAGAVYLAMIRVQKKLHGNGFYRGKEKDDEEFNLCKNVIKILVGILREM